MKRQKQNPPHQNGLRHKRSLSKKNLGASNKKMQRILSLFTVLTLAAASATAYTIFSKKHLWSGHNALDSSIRRSLVSKTLTGIRGTIYDRSGQAIAQQTTAYTLAANFDTRSEEEKQKQEQTAEKTKADNLERAAKNGRLEQVKAAYEALEADYVSPYIETSADIENAAKAIKSVLGDAVDEEALKEYMEEGMKNNRSQIELGPGTKRLSREIKEKLENLKIPGISFLETVQREYPGTEYGSNLIGAAPYDENTQTLKGTVGLEQSLDSYLHATDGLLQYTQSKTYEMLPGSSKVLEESSNGYNVKLTLDASLQNTVDEQVKKTLDENKASKAWCIVLEAETGKILAYSSMPTYTMKPVSFEDNIAGVVFEPGSVMKPLVYAMAVDAGVYPHNKTYRAGSFAYTVDDKTGKITRVSDPSESNYPVIYDALGTDYGTLTFDEGLAHSSNIAICELLSNYLTPELYSRYLDAFKLYEITNTPYITEAPESLILQNTDNPIGYLNSGFGQGSSLTPLDLVQAFTAIFNDGKMMMPYLVDSITDPATGEKVMQFSPTVAGYPISENAAHEVAQMMEHVTDEGMTGDRFAIDGVDMALKTGTGEIFDNAAGAYDKVNYTSSVLAAAPASDPKVIVYWGMVSPNYLNYSAAPFQTIMQAALSAASVNTGTGSKDTDPYDSWETYEMPALTNHSVDYALSHMEDKKVSTILLGDGSTVIEQFPAAGSVLNSNDTVLLLTEGKSILMPNMIGWTRKDLAAFWSLTGIKVTITPPEASGLVIWQNIDPGVPIDASSGIEVELEQKKDDS